MFLSNSLQLIRRAGNICSFSALNEPQPVVTRQLSEANRLTTPTARVSHHWAVIFLAENVLTAPYASYALEVPKITNSSNGDSNLLFLSKGAVQGELNRTCCGFGETGSKPALHPARVSFPKNAQPAALQESHGTGVCPTQRGSGRCSARTLDYECEWLHRTPILWGH